VAAIADLDAQPEVDVIVVARGGGSLEDLLPFSNETMLRAVAACRTPVVSAIGHEVDNPLLDLVADARASTPTDAGRRVVPDVGEELARVLQARQRMAVSVRTRLEREAATVRELRERAGRSVQALLDGAAEQVTGLRERASRAVHGRLARAVDDVAHLRERVRALSPAATLARGYAVVQDDAGAVIRRPDQAPTGSRLRLRLAEGDLAAQSLGPEDPDDN